LTGSDASAVATVSITDLFPDYWHPRIDVELPPGWRYLLASGSDLDERAKLVDEADFLFCGSATPTDAMLESAQHLRFVQKLGAGFDNINVELCKELGIGIARLNGNNAVAVAEHTVMLMLAVYRQLVRLDAQVRGGGWGKQLARNGNREIRGKVVGIVGFGRIGREVAKRVAAFEADIVYYDPQRAPKDVEAKLGARPESLEALLAQSDIVTLHAPVFDETRQLIDRRRIVAMKPGAVLINCGRGELVEEPALLDALRDGHLAGAGIDCPAEEKPGGTEAFWDMENVVLTPHVAGVSEDNFTTMMQRAFANARSVLEGGELPPDDVIWMPER
jgi:phosphoglycerate dehydrogenase-like enzyme